MSSLLEMIREIRVPRHALTIAVLSACGYLAITVAWPAVRTTTTAVRETAHTVKDVQRTIQPKSRSAVQEQEARHQWCDGANPAQPMRQGDGTWRLVYPDGHAEAFPGPSSSAANAAAYRYCYR